VYCNVVNLAPPVKNWRIFFGANFYCPHAVVSGNQRVWIRAKTEFFSTVLSTLSLYLTYISCMYVVISNYDGRKTRLHFD